MVQAPETANRDAAPDDQGGLIRRRLICSGVVQGVGFRPAVYRLATDRALSGFVRNDNRGATIEVEGPAPSVDSFAHHLHEDLPPLAVLQNVQAIELTPTGSSGFHVEITEYRRGRGDALTPPDTAVCPACKVELDDPQDRRHRYPFTNCTDCGPRYSVIRTLPYDRSRTSMECFPLCAECAREYGDPTSRRFHAEPVACPACGPEARLLDGEGRELASGGDALERARADLVAGRIVAVKGLGGYQLACRADSEEAVARLRRRKQRPSKPLAVMARDLAVARRLVHLGPEDEHLIMSSRGPILLAPARGCGLVAPNVAPGVYDLGVMVPTTPLHRELFRDAGYQALVMTSGNASEEPICVGNREALARLSGIADRLLVHDRDIVRRVDDSVVRAMPCLEYCIVRRSRGFVPGSLPLPEPAADPVLALGGHLQSTACVASGFRAYPSQHVGDLDTESARAFLIEVAEGLEDFLEVKARSIVTDLHPDYPSTWIGGELARERGGKSIGVQHHLAHLAAVLGERNAFPRRGERVAGIVLDGTGYGTDGTAWGCEWLMLDGDLCWSRLAHGSRFPLVGGERAVREPWRLVAAVLGLAGETDVLDALPVAETVPTSELRKVAELARGSWPLACGAGRVFEAAGAMLGLCPRNGFEGEAAMRLEAEAMSAVDSASDWQEVKLSRKRVLPQDELLLAAAHRLVDGQSRAQVAGGFVRTFNRLVVELTLSVLPADVRTVALAGGCFVNRLLTPHLSAELHGQGLRPLWPDELPPGDGGLSYGQAVLAAVAGARGCAPLEVPVTQPA